MAQKVRCFVLAFALSCTCIALLFASGCGEKKSPSDGASSSNGAAAETSKKVPLEATKAEPLLGTWKVVKAEGQYAESNTGVVWSFAEGGKAVSAAMIDPNATGRTEHPQSTGREVEKKVEWSWRRVDPGSIELSHRSSGNIASIRHKMEGAQLVLDWNNGSQVLYLEKKN